MNGSIIPDWLRLWREIRGEKLLEALRHQIDRDDAKKGDLKRLREEPTEEECNRIVLHLLDYQGLGACPRCGTSLGDISHRNGRGLLVCGNAHCRHQMSLVSLTFMRGSRVPKAVWFSIANELLEADGSVSTNALAKRHGLKFDTVKRMRRVLADALARNGLLARGKRAPGIKRNEKPPSRRQRREEAKALFDGLKLRQKETLARWVLEESAVSEHAFWTVVLQWAVERNRKKRRG